MKHIIALLTAGIIMGAPSAMAADAFTRALRIGDSGADVLKLQQLLNQDARTQVAEFGVGSAGQESIYFGSKTAQAVKRFQELYRDTVLAPIGLTAGTGIVGEKTRLKLNDLFGAALPAGPAVTISSLSESSVPAGSSIVVRGIGLGGAPVTVVFGRSSLAATLHPTETDAVVFTVPAGTISGIYDIVLKTADGRTSNRLKVRVMGTGAGVAAATDNPYISQLSPSQGGYGAQVVILGSGFSTQPVNKVTFGAQTFEGLASADGKTLIITLPLTMKGLAFPAETLAGLSPEIPLGVMVSKSGTDSNVAVFNFTFYQ